MLTCLFRSPFLRVLNLMALSSLVLTSSVVAQSEDALLQKLIEKGILNSREAEEIRSAAKAQTNVARVETFKTSEWLDSIRIEGDLRLRYENLLSSKPEFVNRTRYRYRLRVGAVAVLQDNFDVGFRLISGEMGRENFNNLDPLSGNQTYENNAAKKPIGVDLAYVRWRALKGSDWNTHVTAGKMENPYNYTDVVFDPDYTPEGIAQQFSYEISKQHAASLNVGIFLLDELGASGRDPFFTGLQVRLDSTWSDPWQSTLGAGALAISGTDNLTTANVPDQGRGNTRNTRGDLVNDFNPLIADASLTYKLDSFPFYPGEFPVRLGSLYMYNPGAEEQNQAYDLGIFFGKAGRQKSWELSYRWKHLEADAWYEEMVDSESGAFYRVASPQGRAGYGVGTNIEGHVIRGIYSPFNSLNLMATYYLFELIRESPSGSDSRANRFQIEATWRF